MHEARCAGKLGQSQPPQDVGWVPYNRPHSLNRQSKPQGRCDREAEYTVIWYYKLIEGGGGGGGGEKG